jgi:hypothetical protein
MIYIESRQTTPTYLMESFTNKSNLITVYTEANFDTTSEYIPFDPSEVNEIVMTNDGKFKPINNYLMEELSYDTIPFKIGSIENNTERYIVSYITISDKEIFIEGNVKNLLMRKNIIKKLHIYPIQYLQKWFSTNRIEREEIEISQEDGTIKKATEIKQISNKDYNLSDAQMRSSLSNSPFKTDFNAPLLLKPCKIPDNLTSMSNAVIFYSDPNYESLYDYFLVIQKQMLIIFHYSLKVRIKNTRSCQ